eukprot:gene11229-15069_t
MVLVPTQRNYLIIFLVIVILMVHSEHSNEKIFENCNYKIPTEGTWLNAPPYWLANGCRNQLFSPQSAAKCMKGRTLYAIGNSVGRQYAFGLMELLGGTTVKREGQRDICPKHETFWGDSCHDEFADVKFKYLFLQFMDGFNYTDRGGFPFLKHEENFPILPNTPNEAMGKEAFWADDNCINMDVRKCLQIFFNGSTDNDVLMFTLGMSYATDNDIIDVNSWGQNSAAAFRGHLDSTFPGRVFHVTMAQALHQVASMTPYLRIVDNYLWNLWRPGSVSVNKRWHTIDQWHINEGRDYFYNDHIHFNGPLTQATLYQVLNIVCPGEGEQNIVTGTSDSNDDEFLMTRIVKWNAANNTFSPSIQLTKIDLKDGSDYYYINNDNQLRKFVGKMSCLNVINKKNVINLDEKLFHKLTRVADMPDVCSNRDLIRSGKEVFMMDDGKRRSIPSRDKFFQLGLDFDDVKVISEADISIIPVGPSL